MKKLLISAAIVAGASFGMQGQANAACGEFQMSDMNWPSATLMANVDKIILEEGYGCTIELIPGATMPFGTSAKATSSAAATK